MSQPSGLAYCKSNGYLYGISDHGNAISQMDLNGTNIQQLWFSPNYLDIEAVGCDDDLKLLYIASEGYRQQPSAASPQACHPPIDATSTHVLIAGVSLYHTASDWCIRSSSMTTRRRVA